MQSLTPFPGRHFLWYRLYTLFKGHTIYYIKTPYYFLRRTFIARDLYFEMFYSLSKNRGLSDGNNNNSSTMLLSKVPVSKSSNVYF